MVTDKTSPFPKSARIYVPGSRPDVLVPMREIALAPSRRPDGTLTPNEPLRVYDTSGPWGDTSFHHDVELGLPAIRLPWILERNDVEAVAGRELGDLGVVLDWHDAGHDGHVHTEFVNVVDKPEVSIRVVEILGDGRVRTRFHLGHKGLDIGLGRLGLGVNFGVSRHFDVEIVTGLGPDKGHQIAGVMELTPCAITAGQVATQSHQAFDAHGFECGQLRTHRLFGRTNAGEVRCSTHTFGQDIAHGIESTLLGGATGTKGDGAKSRLQGVELLAH